MIRGTALFALLLLAGCSLAKGETAAEAYRRGVAALDKGDARTARIEFLNALKEDPRSPAAHLMQARTYLALGDGVAAEAELDRAHDLGVPAAQTGPLMAHALILRNEAQDALQQVAGLHDSYAERMRGRALALLGDPGAADAFDRALALAPRDGALWADVARFRRGQGEIGGALIAADKAVALDPQAADALTLRGELTRTQYGLRAALPWFDRAIQADPDDVDARLERAATLGDLGEMRAMLEETRAVLSRERGNAMAFYLQAVLAARAHNYRLARGLYQRTGGKLDGQPATMLLAGAIDLETGSPAQAATRLSQLLDLQPDNVRVRRLLAVAAWRSGDVAGTIATLQPLVDRSDADSYALSLMGRALAKRGDARAALYLARAAAPQAGASAAMLAGPEETARIGDLRSDADSRPREADPQIRLIRALLAAGAEDEALQRARALAAAHPGVPDVYLLVGDALGAEGQFAGAAEQYRKAADLAFTEPVAMRLIQALDQSGQDAAAGTVLSLFLSQNPRNVAAQLLAAKRAMEARQWDDAIALYESLRGRLGDRDALMLNNLALAYSEQGQTARALVLARRAWMLDRDNPATTDTLGWLLLKSGGNKAEALALLQQAAQGAPSDTRIRAHLSAARSG